MRGKGALLLSVVLGLLAVLTMAVYVSSRESQLLELSTLRDVLVATGDILENTVIDERMVQRIQIPSKYVQPQAIADVREAIGRVVAVPIPGGSQIVGTYLYDAGRIGLAYEVPRGRRAVTIAVSDVTGVSGLVRPGNFVDIFGTFEFGRPIGMQGGRVQYADERTETRVLMQNVQLVAVERELGRERPTPTASGGGFLSAADADHQAGLAAGREIRNVTVVVAPRQAQELVLAQEIGTLTLALRSTLDTGQAEGLDTLDPFGLLNAPIPVKARPRPVWREIRGTGGVF
jgi:pilus assembly protein CpaB